MSRPSLPSTPLPGTPTLKIPSPTRTPSPLPLFSTGGPYTYTGQITRKYASRFNEINKTKNSVKDVEDAWKKEAQDKGVAVHELMGTSEKEYVWEDKAAPRVEETLPQETVIEEGPEEVVMATEKLTPVKGHQRAFSLEEDQFVDALQSPIEKPRDWKEWTESIER